MSKQQPSAFSNISRIDLRRWASALTFLACVIGCRSHDPAVLRVGTFEFTKRDIDRRNEVQKILYPGSDEKLGEHALVRAYRLAEIMKNVGHPVTDEQILAEETRIEKNTKAPEKIYAIKKIFGSDKDAYRRLFVLPTFVEQELPFNLFPRLRVVHQTRAQYAQDILRQVQTTKKPFRSFAGSGEVTYRELELSRNEGFRWFDSRERMKRRQTASQKKKTSINAREINLNREWQRAQDWFSEIIANTKPGSVYHKVVEDDGSFMIVRVKKRLSSTKYHLEVLTLPKLHYTAWIEDAQSKVPVQNLKFEN